MKTLKQWNKRDRLIKKGEKAKGFTKSGKALFKKKQTQIMSLRDSQTSPAYYSSYSYENDECDYDECDEHLWLDPLNQ